MSDTRHEAYNIFAEPASSIVDEALASIGLTDEWFERERMARENAVIITHLPANLFPEFDPNNNINYRARRTDEGVEYTVVVPYDFTLDCINFHLDRARYLRDTLNRFEEIYLIIDLFIQKYKNYPVTRSIIITTICEYLNESELDNRYIKSIFQKLADDTHYNFNIMCEFVEQLDGDVYGCAVMACSVQWTQFTYTASTVRNCMNTRYFTEQLSDDQMEKYFDHLIFLENVHFTQFITRCIFPDWLDDEDFQYYLLYWLVSNAKLDSLKFCIKENDFWYGVTFYHEVVIDTLVRVFAECKMNINTRNYFINIFDFIFETFDLSKHIMKIIAKTIDLIDYNPFLEHSWDFSFSYLMNVLEEQITPTKYKLFQICIMRRFMETGNYYMMKNFHRRYFDHITNVRMMIHCLNWADPNQLVLEPVPQFFAEAMYYDLSREEMNTVFSAMCKEENVPALYWMINHDYEQYFSIVVEDGKLVSFKIREDDFNIIVFDRYTPLAERGMVVKNMEDITDKRDECIVCMEQLEGTNIVVPNCHHSHQMCENCCVVLIQETYNCPMCRGVMDMNECRVFVL
jgi:hypothetical protein